jgi:hypothetical protein
MADVKETSPTCTAEPEVESPHASLSCFFDAKLADNMIQELEEFAKQSSPIDGSSLNEELLYQRFSAFLDKYQEQPYLADPHLPQMIERLFALILDAKHQKGPLFHLVCKFLYHISKLRGFKNTTRHFPHEASQLHLAISLLQSQSTAEASNWQTRQILLLWLSVLVLTPFHLKRFDDGEEKHSLMQRIYSLILEYLPLSEKSSDAAAFLAARFFSRPEVTQLYLNKFVDWSCDGRLNTNGVLLALAYLFKLGKREEMRACALRLLNDLLTWDILSDKHRLYTKNLVKLVQRIGLCFLKIRIASWRYQRGRRSLLENLKGSLQSESRSVNEDDKGDDQSGDTEEDEEEDEELLEKIGDLVHLLLQALKHKSTQVRWSAAKGCGRISDRLSAEQADQIVQGVLQLLQPLEPDSAWQGGCLALAELSRRGLLLPSNFPEVMKALSNALTFEQSRGGFSVGANVRDAACYLSWAFARAFDRNVLLPYANLLASNLAVVALFDREVNIRRAASAAFQENAGRQGNFPNGIEVLTTIDHMAVSLPSRSYVELSVKVAQYEPYRRPILDHLMNFKVSHWDANIRELAAKALGQLCSVLDVQDVQGQLDSLIKFAECSNPFEIHGGLYSIAALLEGLAKRKKADSDSNWPTGQDLIKPEQFARIRDLILISSDKLLHLSCHGDLICEALCVLILSFSSAELPIYEDSTLVEKCTEILLKRLANASNEVRAASADALAAHSAQFLAQNYDRKTRLIHELLARLRAGPEHRLEGALTAIGLLKSKLLDPDTTTLLFGTVLRSLNAQVLHSERTYHSARATAVRSLCRLVLNVLPETLFGLRDFLLELFQYCLQDAMQDYRRFQQRDIGFAQRQAAVETVGTLFQYFSDHKLHTSLLDELAVDSLQQLSSHCVGPQDLMRKSAISSFHTVVTSLKGDEFNEFRGWFNDESDLNTLHHEQNCFRFFVRLFAEKRFVPCLWKGYSLSTGSLSDSIASHSRKALLVFLRQSRTEQESHFYHVIEAVLLLLSSSSGNELWSIPLLRTFEMLIQSGVLDNLPIEERRRAIQECWDSAKKSEDIRKITVCSSTLSAALRFEGESLHHIL